MPQPQMVAQHQPRRMTLTQRCHQHLPLVMTIDRWSLDEMLMIPVYYSLK